MPLPGGCGAALLIAAAVAELCLGLGLFAGPDADAVPEFGSCAREVVAVGGVGQDEQGYVATSGVEGDVGLWDRWDVVVAEAEEHVAVQLCCEAGAVSGQQRVDVGLAGPPNRVRVVGRDHGGWYVGAMQPAVVRLAWREAVYVLPGFSEECSRLLDRGLPQRFGGARGVTLGGADGRDRHVLLTVREAQQRHGVVTAMSRLGDDGEASAERMANADDRDLRKWRPTELRRGLRQRP